MQGILNTHILIKTTISVCYLSTKPQYLSLSSVLRGTEQKWQKTVKVKGKSLILQTRNEIAPWECKLPVFKGRTGY